MHIVLGEHGVARRLWHLCKMEFLTIMVWELSFLPSSSWDMWLHRARQRLVTIPPYAHPLYTHNPNTHNP